MSVGQVAVSRKQHEPRKMLDTLSCWLAKIEHWLWCCATSPNINWVKLNWLVKTYVINKCGKFCLKIVLHYIDTGPVPDVPDASRCSSVSMGWHRTTCLLCATLHPDSMDARIFALRIADSSTFHELHCRRAVFEPSLPVHLKNRNLTLTTFMRHLKSYLFSQYWFCIEHVWGVIT